MTKSLSHTPKSCWEVFSGPKHEKAMDELALSYVEFLSRCKTERETAAHVLKRASEAGFSEKASSGRFMKSIRGKSVLLVRKGKKPMSQGLRILGAHCDTPRLDLKQHPLYEDCEVGLAKTHYYGGIRKHQWFSRPLSLHGVVVKENGKVLSLTLGEEPGEPVFAISDLLPHLATKQNEQKLGDAFEGEKMNVLMGHAPSKRGAEEKGSKKGKDGKVKQRVLELLNAKYNVVEEDLFSAELQMVPAGPARFVGLDGSLIGGYGQDDRICVFAGLEAFLAEKTPEYTQVVVFWDKEEIGSEGGTSARALFLE